MGKTKISRLVTDSDINCLENVVVAYNTVFLVLSPVKPSSDEVSNLHKPFSVQRHLVQDPTGKGSRVGIELYDLLSCLNDIYDDDYNIIYIYIMSSIFVVLTATTTRELFSEVHRILTPSLLLSVVACFIIFIAVLGYVGVGKKSSSLISLYSILLIFIFILEISAGLGILSFRKEIQSMVTLKMKKTIAEYPDDQMTANLVDYVQLQLECCGVNSFRDWDEVLEKGYQSSCKIGDITLPNSCCLKAPNATLSTVNRRGCMPAVNFLLQKSTLSLTVAILAVCTIQILGAYISYSLASTLNKYKIQKVVTTHNLPPPYETTTHVNFNEKSGYF